MSAVLSGVSNSIPDRQALFLFLGTSDLQTLSFSNSELGVCFENMLSDIIFKQGRNVNIQSLLRCKDVWTNLTLLTSARQKHH